MILNKQFIVANYIFLKMHLISECNSLIESITFILHLYYIYFTVSVHKVSRIRAQQLLSI
jgi:hypothetical protein